MATSGNGGRMIGPGSSCVIAHDIIIGGQVAFRAGEHVTIEQIAPHAQMPDNKYVVLSTTLQQRFQLKAANLQEVSDQPPVFIPPSPPPAKKKVPIQPVEAKAKAASAGDKKNTLAGCLGILVSVIVIIVVVAVIVSSSGKKENKVETSPVETSTTPATPPVQKTMQTVFTLSGNSDRRSESFTLTGGEQKLIYNVTGAEMPMCAIYVVEKGTSLESDGGFPEVDIDQAGSSDTRMVKDPGEYYLDVKAVNCQWTVTIQELR